MKESDLAQLAVLDEKTSTLAREAARAFSAFDQGAVASVAKTLGGVDMSKFVDVSAMRAASQAFEAMRPIVAPQMEAAAAESLKGISMPSAAAFKAIEPPTFQFAKTLDDARIASQFHGRMAEAMKAWQMPSGFMSAVADSLRASPRTAGGSGGSLAPRAGDAVREAVILAESSAAESIADETLAHADLSPAERRELQTDVLDAIAALGTLVALLADDGRIELASAGLAFLAILVSIYWRVSGKLDA